MKNSTTVLWCRSWILLSIIWIFALSNIFAQVNINRVNPLYIDGNGITQCASLEFELTGNTGPYQVEIWSSDGFRVWEEEELQGVVFLSPAEAPQLLCYEGTYTIKVTNKFGCVLEEESSTNNQFQIRACWPPNQGIPYEIVKYPSHCFSSDGQVAISGADTESLDILLADSDGNNISRSYDEASNQYIWDGVSIGSYTFYARTKDCGYFITEDFEIEGGELEAEVLGSCNSDQNGEIDLVAALGLDANTYTVIWEDDGSSDLTRSNLSPGTYCAQISSNGNASGDCSFRQCFEIVDADLTIIDQTVVNNECGEDCIGSIDLEVSSSLPISYEWSNGAITQDQEGLCAGEYEVTISSGACQEILSFEIETEEPQNWTYTVETILGFRPYLSSSEAIIYIHSEVFKAGEGTLNVSFNALMEPFGTPGRFFPLEGYASITIPDIYRHFPTFFFTYEINGCTYSGTIENSNYMDIPICMDDKNNFSFWVEYTEDEFTACSPERTHSYDLHITDYGENAPFFIRVYMEEAAFPEDEDFIRIIPITAGQMVVEVIGIPSGKVVFEAYNYCGDSVLALDYHDNCCRTFNCDLLSENLDGTGYEYDFEYFQIYTHHSEECFELGESNIEIRKPNGSTFFNDSGSQPFQTPNKCWTGTITITYPPKSLGAVVPDPLVLEVREQNDAYHEVVRISGDDNYRPDEEGTYEIRINYTGTGPSLGIDCEYTLEVNYYGPRNASPAVGLLNEYTPYFEYYLDQYNLGTPYYAAWTCETCGSDEEYLTNINDCDAGNGALQPVYFTFEPMDYEDPCNSGGTLTYLDFDENGVPIKKTIEIPADTLGTNLGQDGLQPIPGSIGNLYTKSGWCLFEASLVYDFPFDHPLLATWFDPNSEQAVWVPGSDNNTTCSENGENTCPEGTTCVGGRCLIDCPDGICQNGTCVNGYCELDEADLENSCPYPCPDGYSCYYGQCILDVDPCGFSTGKTGGQGTQNYVFKFENVSEQEIRLDYDTYTLKDKVWLYIDGILVYSTGYTATDGLESSGSFPISGTGIIEVVFEPENNNKSEHEFTIVCINTPTIIGDQGERLMQDTRGVFSEGFNVHPNPFTQKLTLEVNAEIDETVDLLILDNLGRQVLQQKIDLHKGNNRQQIKAPDLKPGIYFVKIIDRANQFAGAKKIIKI